MMINSPVQQIKERLSIEEIVSSYIKLEKAGANFKARCPFHNEKTPSFFVSPDRASYYCFGCGAKGDIFSFIEEFEGLDFKGALKILAERAGIPLVQYSKEKEGEKEKLYRAMEEATKFFEKNLAENKKILEYLKSRGLEEKTIGDFKIGFSLLDWRTLFEYLKSKGFSDKEIELAGLVKKTEKGFYDRFRGRIMFPISDSSGRIIAFSGRIFEDDGKSAKYLNSPDTPIFSKSAVLYGLDKAKESIRKNNFSILVEGQMDLILSHQAGFRNTVATSGTALSDATVSKENVVSNLGLLRRLSGNIILAFDADRAGFNASSRAGKIALSFGMDVKVVSMSEGIDPASLISQDGTDAWRTAIRNSKHIIEFLLDKILNSHKEDMRKVGREIREKILPYVDSIESAIEKSHFIKIISNKSGIAENALLEDLKKVQSELKFETEEIRTAKENVEKKMRKDPIERRLLGIAFWQENIQDKTIDPELIFQKLDKAKEIYKDIEEDLIYEAEEFYSNSENLQKDVDEMLLNIEEEYLNEELNKKMVELNNFKNKKEEMEILKKINEIIKKKEEIRNNRSR
ncbi:MAG: primase protein [Candidatus Nomurabacteria bacterium GW2011_GWF2_35_12]|nr:MAG: primase protein [Candidatus Nomurabacteria bacterium GW2011_GWF2_35_12]KKP78636.1 MAG: primase protein [Candidatus Nomurabacteria bacterium GW2011_GWC2_35_35]KKP85060.1 MAG: primase protein [Parcubacteria group bacterium GW2011_GWD2_35_7]